MSFNIGATVPSVGTYKDPTGNTDYTYDYVGGKWIAYNKGVTTNISDIPAYAKSVTALNTAYPNVSNPMQTVPALPATQIDNPLDQSLATKPIVDSANPVLPDENFLSQTYQNDLANLAQSKKYLIGNAIGQTLLNTTNLSQAWKDRPAMVGIGAIPNVQYPNVKDSMLAELNAAEGKYRSGIGMLAGQKGLSPEVRIGAEANVLSKDLTQRAAIAELQNTNDIAAITANAAINKANIENQYAAKIADTTRNDTIEANRSALFSTGLSNVAKIGAGVAEGMIGLNDKKTQLGVSNYYLQKYQAATDAAEKAQWYKLYTDALSGTDNTNIAVNTTTSTAEAVK